MGHFIPRKTLFMTYRSYLIRKNPFSSYLFRIRIPIDLRDFFDGRSQFKISLRNGIKSQSIIFSKIVYLEVQSFLSQSEWVQYLKSVLNRYKNFSERRLRGLSFTPNTLLQIRIPSLIRKFRRRFVEITDRTKL